MPTADELSKWYSTQHNSCLAQVAEMEVGAEDILVDDITALQLSQMYSLAICELAKDWEKGHQKLALSHFAARMFCAGRILGRREPLIGKGYAE